MTLQWLAFIPLAAAKWDLVLYGADGCVGHFAAQHLAKQSDLAWAVAGRNRSRLVSLVSTLDSRPDILVASLDEDPTPWLRNTSAVITAAGPFSVHQGEVLLAAAAKLGVHYADTSDEFYWQRWMIDRYDAVAKASGSKVVLSTGFCVLAADLGAALALRGQNGSLDAWLERYEGGVSAGVIHTAEEMRKAKFPKEWETDPYVLAPHASPELRKDSKVEGMGYPAWVAGEGLVVSNLFGPYDARLLRRSFVQRNQQVTLRVGASTGLYPAWAAFLARHPGSWSKLTECPTETVYQDGSWAYRFVAKGRAVLLSGTGDPGYRFTALGLAEIGLALAKKTNIMQSASGGVLTPLTALDVDGLVNRFEAIELLKVQEPSELIF